MFLFILLILPMGSWSSEIPIDDDNRDKDRYGVHDESE